MANQSQAAQDQIQTLKEQKRAAIDQSKAMLEFIQMVKEGRELIAFKRNAVQLDMPDTELI